MLVSSRYLFGYPDRTDGDGGGYDASDAYDGAVNVDGHVAGAVHGHGVAATDADAAVVDSAQCHSRLLRKRPLRPCSCLE